MSLCSSEHFFHKWTRGNSVETDNLTLMGPWPLQCLKGTENLKFIYFSPRPKKLNACNLADDIASTVFECPSVLHSRLKHEYLTNFAIACYDGKMFILPNEDSICPFISL